MDRLRRLSFRWIRFEIEIHLPEECQSLFVTVRPTDTIKDLRVYLVKQGITSWKKYFYYNERQLGEYEAIKDVNITKGSVILLRKNNQSQSGPEPNLQYLRGTPV
ncbi:TINCR ubiquitin domain containing [Bombina bombina]|uniref:TINCR ubiquitin domain containing n=1 Tax=Bombina bombina TaxID=8345 RepID=UPI00235B2C23|nr:TINCR ubiquitin domain containing [Bombina bombina]